MTGDASPLFPQSSDDEKSGGARKSTVGPLFVPLTALIQVLVLMGLFFIARPTQLHYNDPAKDTQLYNYFVGVTLMMFVGFGYLMTFLRWYGLGAVGLTMLVTALGMQVMLLVEPLFEHGVKPFPVDMMSLLRGNFGVAAFLISFGGLIGKVNPTQLVILVVIEAVCYSANKVLFLDGALSVADCGGTIIIHMFGAYFGLAAARVLGEPEKMEKETSSTVSDVFSLIGTTFLWLYWPSFVAGEIAPGTMESEIALTNTVFALLGSTVTTFLVSAALSGGMLRPVDIQNATLAGGVSIGSTANLNLGPFGAVFIGCLAGLVSTVGFSKIQPLLHEKIGLHDSCGIHNLHGMPSVLGGLASAAVPLFIEQGDGGVIGKPVTQLLGIAGTIVVAVATGAITGGIMKAVQDPRATTGFDDSECWEVAEDFGKA